MADRYWVGGTGTWDSSNTANWSDTSGGSSGSSVPTSSDNVFLDANSGSGTITTTSTQAICNNFTSTYPSTIGTIYVHGNIYKDSSATISTINIVGSSGIQTIEHTSLSALCTSFIKDSASTCKFLSNVVTSGTFTFTAGPLDFNGFSLTCLIFNSNNTNNREIIGDNSYILITNASNLGTVNHTNLTMPNTVWLKPTRNTTGTARELTLNNATNASCFSIETVPMLASNTCDLTILGTNSTSTINIRHFKVEQNSTGAPTLLLATGLYGYYGDITLASNTSLSFILYESAANPTTKFTSNGFTCSTITLNKNLDTLELQDALSATTSILLQSGTFNINGYSITTPLIKTENNNFGGSKNTIAFGSTGVAYISGTSGSLAAFSTNTPILITGSKKLQFTASPSSGTTRTYANTVLVVGSERCFNLFVGSGSDTVAASQVDEMDYTGFTGTISTISIKNGNIVAPDISAISSTMTIRNNSGNVFLQIPAGISSFNFSKSGNSSVILERNFVFGTFTLNEGTVDTNGYDITSMTSFTSNPTANTSRTLLLNEDTILTITGAVTLNSTNLNIPIDNLTLKLTSASSKTFGGNSGVYENITVEQAGAGQLTFTGSNTFNDITNTHAGASTVRFTSGTTTKVKNFSLSGSAGNLVSIISVTSGSPFTLEKIA